MKYRLVAGGVAVVVGALALGAAFTDRGPFAESLGARQQAVLDEVENRAATTGTGEAARYVEANIDVLLSAEIADAADGDALAGLFASALAGGEETDAELFGLLVVEVAGESEIHAASLRPVFADAGAARVDWFDARIGDAFSTGTPLPDEVREDYLAAHDFLREVMRGPGAAAILHDAVDRYGRVEASVAPDAGEDRVRRLSDLGRLQAFFVEARLNAGAGEDDEPAEAEGDGGAGWGADPRMTATVDRAVWVALDRFESDPAVRESAAGEPFVDGTGALKADMTGSEEEALRAWALSLATDGGLTDRDVNALRGGSDSVLNPDRAIVIEDRG